MRYREVLEVAKWTSIADLRRWEVSRLWASVVQAEELWRVVVEEHADNCAVLPDETYKQCIRRTAFTRFSVPLCSPFAVRFFRAISSTWSPAVPLTQEIAWDVSSACAIVDADRVLACGGGAELMRMWTSAYLVAKNGTVERVGDMRQGRCYHGVAVVETCVYALCGRTTASERYSLLSRSWQSLAKLNVSLSCLVPCVCQAQIYLPTQPSVLVYNTREDKWTDTAFSSLEAGVSVVWRDTVHIVTRTDCWTVADDVCVSARAHEKWGNVWGNSTAVVRGDVCYIPWGQVLQRIELSWLRRECVRPCLLR